MLRCSMGSCSGLSRSGVKCDNVWVVNEVVFKRLKASTKFWGSMS